MDKVDLSAKWLIIVNPNAGRQRGRKDWTHISSLLAGRGVEFDVVFTERQRHAIEITRNGIADGYRKIAAVGGDGTMNEVVNGVFLQEVVPTDQITIGIITVGTGNDWGRMFGIPRDYEGAVKLIGENRTCLSDTGVVEFDSPAGRSRRYFINIAGLGFDAVVVRRTNTQKERGRSGKAIYFYNLLKSLLFYTHTHTDVIIDGNLITNQTFTISLGIGRFSGGGMRQTPNAIHDDGLFDITIIKRMRKSEIIRSLKKLYDGTILDHPKIEGYTGKNIIINSKPPIHLEADGESLGYSPIEFNILPKAVNVIYNQET
ncbi:MAG: diacylglycerol kinase family lipid kinase [Bacteroidales bacterium]|nr:diacylglycerol kinase family lipid kinase [Bacteroidales bacterium]